MTRPQTKDFNYNRNYKNNSFNDQINWETVDRPKTYNYAHNQVNNTRNTMRYHTDNS